MEFRRAMLSCAFYLNSFTLSLALTTFNRSSSGKTCFDATQWLHSFSSSPDAAYKVFSQFNQDGVLKSLFSPYHLSTTTKSLVEFGYPDYSIDTSYGNGRHLITNLGFHQELLLDGKYDNPGIKLHKHWLTKDNIVGIFDQYGVSTEPDYVSIDIDSCDLWLFLSLTTKYRPRVVSIEYNSNYGVNDHSTLACKKLGDYMWHQDNIFGASLSAIYLAARKRGYSMVYASAPVDVFLVRDDLLCPGSAPPVEAFQYATGLPLHGPYTGKYGPRQNLVIDFKQWIEQNPGV